MCKPTSGQRMERNYSYKYQQIYIYIYQQTASKEIKNQDKTNRQIIQGFQCKWN